MLHRRHTPAHAAADTPPAQAEPVVVAPRPRSQGGGDRHQQALVAFGDRLGDRNAFAVLSDSIHFHPDLTFGGFGILVLTTPSPRRDPGVYLLDRARAEWARAYLLEDLPEGTWVQICGWDGGALPVQLNRFAGDAVAARWIGRGGASVPPGQWDVTGGPSDADMMLAASEHQSAMSRRFG